MDTTGHKTNYKPYSKLRNWGSILLPFAPMTATVNITYHVGAGDDFQAYRPSLQLKAANKGEAQLVNALSLYKQSPSVTVSGTAMKLKTYAEKVQKAGKKGKQKLAPIVIRLGTTTIHSDGSPIGNFKKAK